MFGNPSLNHQNRRLTAYIQSLGGFPSVPFPKAAGNVLKALFAFSALCDWLSSLMTSVALSAVPLLWGSTELRFIRAHGSLGSLLRGKTDQPVRQDGISVLFTVIATMELVFYNTFLNSVQNASFIAVSIMYGGIILQMFVGFKEREERDDPKKMLQILIYAVFSLVLLVAVNTVVPYVPLSVVSELPQQTALQNSFFYILIAVSEEQFFRGFFLNWIIKEIAHRSGTKGAAFARSAGVAIDGGVFSVYHLYVYGGDASALAIVFLAGMILAYVDLKTGRLSTSILGHVTNNILAIGG